LNIRKSQLNRKLYTGGMLSAITVFIVLYNVTILTQFFEYKITDIKYSVRSMLDKEPEINSSIVMVNLDDYSKKQSGKALWPYPYYTDVIEKISAGGPTSIGMDFILTNAIDTSGWSKLVFSMEESFLLINPYMVDFGDNLELFDVSSHQDILAELNLDEAPQVEPGKINHVVDILYKSQQDIMNSSAGIGFITIVPDMDGVLRRLPVVAEINGLLAPHLTLRLLCEHLQYDLGNIEAVSKWKLILHEFPIGKQTKDIEIPLDGQGNMLINYISDDKIQRLIKSRKFVSISAWDIKNSSVFDLTDRTVIFGDNSAAAKDISSTPIDGLLSNQLIYAIAMSNILQEEFVHRSLPKVTLALLIILLILFFLVANFVDTFRFGLISCGILVMYLLCNFMAFIYFGILIPVLIIFIPLFITSAYMLIFMIYNTQVALGVLEGSLSSMLSPHLMNQIKNNPDILKFGGERKRISVLFSDMVGFTAFTDQADPAEVQAVLEEYYSEMASIVFENKGIVDKYLGDGIVAFFENPPDGITSAQASVKTAMAMKEKAADLDKKYKDQKRFPFAICVGIATGYAQVGNIGHPDKVDYTIIGSVANLASRLDGPGDPGDILMDEDTYHFVKDAYEIEDFGTHVIKGFEKQVQAYRLK